MQTRTKLMVLEAIGGLFGWVWIGASLAAVYYFVSAIGFDGSWSSFFWAFGTSVVSKWLARGFQDSQRRVAFEAQMVSQGMTPEEAGQAWVKTNTGGEAAQGNQALMQAQELVNKYGTVLEQSKVLPAPESLLPAPKQQIKDALVALARHAKASGSSPDAIAPLRAGYSSLADFVPEQEADDAGALQADMAGAADLNDAGLRELAARIADRGGVGAGSPRADEALRLAAEFDERVSAP